MLSVLIFAVAIVVAVVVGLCEPFLFCAVAVLSFKIKYRTIFVEHWPLLWLFVTVVWMPDQTRPELSESGCRCEKCGKRNSGYNYKEIRHGLFAKNT